MGTSSYTEDVYELTLTPDYVSDWDFKDAMRELIQNGIDQEELDAGKSFSMSYDKEKKIIRLINSGRTMLKRNTLLLGKTSKANNDDTVGQFGEGYKIAALVLNREGKAFTIYNNEKKEVWKSRFKNSEKWREKILAFYISRQETSESGLCIEVGNVSEKEYCGLEGVWLGMSDYDKIDTQYGEIITEKEFLGNIYVGGLRIGCNSELKYGYNFKPQYIQLERDRKTCESWNVQENTWKMITEAMVEGNMPDEEVESLISESADDIRHIEYNTYTQNSGKVAKMLITSFDKKNPKEYSIPVSSDNDFRKAKAYGGNPVIVPPLVAELLKEETEKRMVELSKLPVSGALTLKERFLRWYEIYKDKYYTLEYAFKELKELIDELD